MKIALIRCQEHDYPYQQWFEDTQLGVVASLLKKVGGTTHYSIFDFTIKPLIAADDYENNVDKILETFPGLIIFFIEKLPSNQPVYISALVEQLKIHAENLEIHYSIYGVTQPIAEQLLLQIPLDSVVIGEEYDLLGLVSALSAGQSLETVSGIIYRGEDGAIKHNPPSALKIDLDSMPFPERYFLESPMVGVDTENYVAAILGSRGCYAKCNFCSLQAFDQFYKSYNWRGRSPKNIVDEMEYLYKEHNVREFVFQDMNFFGPGRKGQQRVIEFSQELDGRGLEDIAFSLYTRANDVQRDTFELLKSVGLHTVFIGIESFCQSVLDRFDKGMKVEDNLKAIQILKDLDIYLRMGFITFDYYTTFNELKENVRVLKDVFSSKGNLFVQPLLFHNIVTPLAGTPLGKQYELIGAGRDKSNVHYQFGNKLVEHQSRYSRFGQVTIFEDERIAYVSEAARILSGDIWQKFNILQERMLHLINSSSDYDLGKDQELESMSGWIDNLMLFVIDQFQYIVNSLENQAQISAEAPKIVELIKQKNDAYDLDKLGVILKRQYDPALTVID